MQNLVLPKVEERKRYEIKKLVIVLLSLHKDIFISERDIDIEYYDSWDFYKVSIFKVCDKVGHGTPRYRDEYWAKTQKAMSELFSLKYTSDSTWRWAQHTKGWNHKKIEEYETETPGMIPGISYWINNG